MSCRFWLGAMGVALVLTWVLFAVVCYRYRLPQKVWRVAGVEQRIPGLKPRHELNRNYQPSRELFRAYQSTVSPILIFGDSHVRLVSWNELLGRADVANRGLDGDTIDGVAARLGDEREAGPVMVLILVGTNNLLQGAGAESMKEAAQRLLNEAVRLWPGVPLVVGSVPPVANWHVESSRVNQQGRIYNSWLRAHLDTMPDAHLLDVNGLVATERGELAPEMTTDGVHLSAQAYRLIRGELEKRLPEERR
jgi:lysophospholipase L1-like esterase